MKRTKTEVIIEEQKDKTFLIKTNFEDVMNAEEFMKNFEQFAKNKEDIDKELEEMPLAMKNRESALKQDQESVSKIMKVFEKNVSMARLWKKEKELEDVRKGSADNKGEKNQEPSGYIG